MACSMHYPFLDLIGAICGQWFDVKSSKSCRKMLQFNSGHKANVFQSKFMPGDLLITSCSRDGQVGSVASNFNLGLQSQQYHAGAPG